MTAYFSRPRVIAVVILASGLLSALAIVLGSIALVRVTGQAADTCLEVSDLRADLVFVIDQFQERTSSPDYSRFYDAAKRRVEPVRCP